MAPHHDADFKAWVGPFFSGPVNTRVVRRSAALLGYGPDFHQEYLRWRRRDGGPGGGRGQRGHERVYVAAPSVVLGSRPRPAPGTGPGRGAFRSGQDRGSFRCELVGHGDRGTVAHARVAATGILATGHHRHGVSEAALALAKDDRHLQRASGSGGVLTPASGVGEALADAGCAGAG